MKNYDPFELAGIIVGNKYCIYPKKAEQVLRKLSPSVGRALIKTTKLGIEKFIELALKEK